MAIRNREKEPVEEHHSLEAHFGGGIPLALVAKLLASQPGVGQETNNLIEELIIHGEEEEDDDSKDEEMNGVEEMGEDAESEDGNENGEQDNMVTVVTGEYDEVIIHMTEEELAEMRKEEHDGQGEGGEEEEVN